MKKVFFLFALFLISCSPQVTVTSEATVTFALPTTTQTPEPSATPTAVYTPTPQKEIVKRPSGVGIELGPQIEGQPEGVRLINDLIPNPEWKADRQAEFVLRNNPETYGFLPGETQLVYIPTEDGKGRVELQRTSNAEVIAVFGSEGFTWNSEQLVGNDSEPIVIRSGNVIEMKNRVAVDIPSAVSLISKLQDNFFKELSIKYNEKMKTEFYIFISTNGKLGVLVNFYHDKTSKDGILYFMDDDKTVRWLYVKDFDTSLGFVESVHQ